MLYFNILVKGFFSGDIGNTFLKYCDQPDKIYIFIFHYSLLYFISLFEKKKMLLRRKFGENGFKIYQMYLKYTETK